MNADRPAIRAVAFDVDGVLVEIRFPDVLRQTLRMSPGAASEFFDGPFVDCLLGKARLGDVLPPYLERWGWTQSFNQFIDFWFEEESRTCAAVLGAVDRLRAAGVRCFLASTQEHLRADFLEHRLDVGTRFERGFFSCRMGCRKPDPSFFEGVLAETGLKPDEIVLIDDQVANCEGATRMGWRAVNFRIGGDLVGVLRSLGLA